MTLCTFYYKLVCVYVIIYSDFCRKKELIMITRKKFIEKYNDTFKLFGLKKETVLTDGLEFHIDILKDAACHLGRFYAKTLADGNDDLELDIADAVALEMAVLDDIANRLREVRNDVISVETIEEIEYERKKKNEKKQKSVMLGSPKPISTTDGGK